MSNETLLGLDLLDLAYASISEVGLTGGPISSLVSMYEALLTDDTMLTWRGRGLGLGRELRRSYSNIHGRIFARSYLEANEGLRGFCRSRAIIFRLPTVPLFEYAMVKWVTCPIESAGMKLSMLWQKQRVRTVAGIGKRAFGMVTLRHKVYKRHKNK